MIEKCKEKTSKLVFDARVGRKLLKLNGEFKYCPYCATPISVGCSCHKNFIVDIKKKRETENETILVFSNNDQFQADYEEVIAEFTKKNFEPEQLTFDCGD